MDNYQKFIATSRYARWLDKEQRRETWNETVDRYIDYVQSDLNMDDIHYGGALEDAREAIKNLEVMPSMRALMSAGPALERCNVAGYNCAYLPIDSLRSFDETMYILMCGAGVGFSVERKNVNKLPIINEHFEQSDTRIVVGDSKAGWARAFRELLHLLYSGQVPEIDYSRIRPAGARLKTFGGRASGPEPLKDLFTFCIQTIKKAAGRRLSSLEAHDIVCKTAEVVVVGGVRRSALISLSDLDDHEMAKAKSGQWWDTHPHRALANNSAVYEEKPGVGQFLEEWKNIYESRSGERGIFSRAAVRRQVARNERRQSEGIDFGTNPCSEIILRPYQFCNLTEVVVRHDDTVESLQRKLDTAVFLGTVQSRWTDFKYLRKIWRDNCEEERLLGVSLTGIYDNPGLMFNTETLRELRDYAVSRNKYYADLFGINQSCAVTCVKPSGTVSQLVNSASGLHPRYAKYYKRTVRGDNKDPLTNFLRESGVEVEPCVMKPDSTSVFTFYQKAPDNAVTTKDISCVEHLWDWFDIQEHWCEHKPSVTINIPEDQWINMASEIYKIFDKMSGVSVLPADDHVYKQAPYQEITEEEFNNAPIYEIDWSKLSEFEKEDTTKGTQTLACTGNYCEIVDL
jgi:ribonucleoside-triphosphate reductase